MLGIELAVDDGDALCFRLGCTDGCALGIMLALDVGNMLCISLEGSSDGRGLGLVEGA